MLRERELIVLLGAGCSKKAGIPISKEMIDELEKLIESNIDWKEFNSTLTI